MLISHNVHRQSGINVRLGILTFSWHHHGNRFIEPRGRSKKHFSQLMRTGMMAI